MVEPQAQGPLEPRELEKEGRTLPWVLWVEHGPAHLDPRLLAPELRQDKFLCYSRPRAAVDDRSQVVAQRARGAGRAGFRGPQSMGSQGGSSARTETRPGCMVEAPGGGGWHTSLLIRGRLTARGAALP